MNYWIVGATFVGGMDDALESFIQRGYWYCWDKKVPTGEESKGPNSIERQIEKFKEISIGDKIAVKKIHSVPEQKMEVRALGIVKDIDFEEWRVYVDWKVQFKHLERIVDLHGWSASIHGPYQSSDTKIHKVFCL